MEEAVQESNDFPIKDVKGTSLFDLCLVKVSWQNRDFINLFGTESETVLQHPKIYGYIFLMDDQGNEFALFYRDRDNAVKVTVDIGISVSTITLEKFQFESPRVSPSTFCLVFYLKEAYRDTLIADQVKFIDNTTTEVVYDQVYRFEVESQLATVTVEYTIFQCALSACVGLIIEKIGEDEIDEGDDVYAEMKGTICASFKVRDGSCFKYLLCNSHSRHEFGNFVKLSNFGVPAYSLLDIQANVNITDEVFRSCNNDLEFDPCDIFRNMPYEKEMVGQKFRMRMLVNGVMQFFISLKLFYASGVIVPEEK